MRSITIDSRNPGQPIIEPSQTREELRREAAILDLLAEIEVPVVVVESTEVTEVSAFQRYVKRRLIVAQG